MEIIEIKDLFQNYKLVPNRTRRTERGDLITSFLEELNPARISQGLKPLKYAFLSMKFSQSKMTTSQLYQFLQDCKRAKNFSSYFWWALKPKNVIHK